MQIQAELVFDEEGGIHGATRTLPATEESIGRLFVAAARRLTNEVASGTLTVVHTLQRIGGEVVLTDPKTAKSRRTLSVPAPVLASLREHRKRQLGERLAAGESWQDGGFVFCSEIGTPLDASAVTHRFQRQLAAAGLPRQRFHDLRHGAASYLLAAGVPLRVVQEVLGHSQLSTTADVYAHVLPELQQDAADRMGTLLEAMERTS